MNRSCWSSPLLLLLGCSPACATYAPPLKTPHYGAPGRIKEGELEITGAVAGTFAPVMGGGFVGYAITDQVSLEVGGDGMAGGWAMGFAGARWTIDPWPERSMRFIFDNALHLGAGVGGERCDTNTEDGSCSGDGLASLERFAGGAALESGVGWQVKWFSTYIRPRLQLTRARNLPTTLWTTAHLGFQFRIAKVVDLYSSAGYASFTNRADTMHGWTYDIGLSVHFRVRRSCH